MTVYIDLYSKHFILIEDCDRDRDCTIVGSFFNF